MKCEMCGNEVERKFELFVPVKDKADEVISCCGACKVLCEINDSLKAKKSNSFSPIING